MGQVPVAHNEGLNLGLLSEKMSREVVENLFFEKFTNEVIREGLNDVEKRPAMAPIQRFVDFTNKGMDHMLIPVEKPYTNAPFYGDDIVTGKGEKDKWDYSRLYINQLQLPVEGPGRMGEQRVTALNLVARRRAKLSLLMARTRETQLVSAAYEGFSRHITAAVSVSGLAKSKRYHPNFYVAGSGPSTWSGTVQTHANNIGADLDALTGGTSQEFNVDNLEDFRAYVQNIPIEPIEVDGKAFYVMLAHYNQIKQLRKDPKFREETSRAGLRGLQNNLFASAEIMYSNFLIFERAFSVWGVQETDTGGGVYTLQFGATNPLAALDSFDKKCAICFGNEFMNEGIATGITIDEQRQNINNYTEVAIRQIVGFSRNDFYDVDIDNSTPTTGKNQSSAIFTTFSS